MMSRMMGIFFALLAFGSVAQAQSKFVAGQDYTELSVAGTVAPKIRKDRVDVAEFFSYACPYCNSFAPLVAAWAERNKAAVNLIYSATPGSTDTHPWTTYSRLHYTVAVLKIGEKTHLAIFNAIHKEKKPMTTPAQMWEVVKVYAVPEKIDEKKFTETYNSFPVSLQVDKARQLANSAGIQGVPSMLVDNRFLLQTSQTKNLPRMLEIAQYLVEEIRAGRK